MAGYQGFYVGMVEAVFPPDHPMNTSKYQYEYRVIISGDSMSTIPCKCVKMDVFGNLNDYDDATMLIGTRVYVQFPRGDMSMGVILGGARQFSLKTDPANGHHWQRRFNEIVQIADKQGAYTVKSVDGPFVKIEKKKITISNVQVKPGTSEIKPDDTEVVESIVFDSVAKTLTVTARELAINVKDPKDAKGNISITVSGNATLDVKKNATINVGKDATIDVKGAATATVAKDLTVKSEGQVNVKSAKKMMVESTDEITVKASKKANIKGQIVTLNGELGQVLTNITDPVVDLITGVPSIGLPTVKAGGG